MGSGLRLEGTENKHMLADGLEDALVEAGFALYPLPKKPMLS